MKTIVVGVTNVPTAEQAALEAAELAAALGATLHLVSCVTERRVTKVGGSGENWQFSSIDAAEEHVRDITGRLADGIEVTSSLSSDDPAASLVAEAERLEADIIVVGSRRTQGLSRVLGSVATDVLHHAPCSVYVAKTT